MLTFNSNPMSNTRELKKISAIMISTVPMEPYNSLKFPNLLTHQEKPALNSSMSTVARKDPGLNHFHFLCTAGAAR